MKLEILHLTITTVVLVSGQFVETEFRVDSAPFNLRRGLGSAFEVRPNVGRAIENLPDRTAQNSNHRWRHNNNQRIIRNGPNQNMQDFIDIPNQNAEYQSNDKNDRESVNPWLANRRDQNVNYNSQFNTQVQQNQENNITANSRQNINKQQSDTEQSRLSQNDGNDRPNSEILSENGFIASNIRTSTARAKINENRQHKFKSNQNITIESNSRVNNNINEKEQNTDINPDNSSNSTDNPLVAVTSNGSSKSAQDNELSKSKPPDSRDDTWVWDNGRETTTLPDLDDRASFDIDGCPTNKIRFKNMCVYRS